MAMIDMDAVGEELAAVAAGADPALTGYGFAPEAPAEPAVFPDAWETDFTTEGTPLGSGAFYQVTMLVLVSRADDMSGARRRNTLVRGIVDALRDADDFTAFSDLMITGARALGDYRDYGTTSYLAAEIDVTVFG